MPSNPDLCDCGSQMYRALWAISNLEGPDSDLDVKGRQQTELRQIGFECVECGNVQLTREVPQRHADDDSLDHPDVADRDMVRE